MGFFERFRGSQPEEPKSFEPRILVPNFEKNEELETLLKEYVETSTRMFGITHDFGIDMNTDINSPKIQENEELKKYAEIYFAGLRRTEEIVNEHGDKLREYLKPYSELQNPPDSPFRVDSDEWDRWRMANTLANILKRKSQN